MIFLVLNCLVGICLCDDGNVDGKDVAWVKCAEPTSSYACLILESIDAPNAAALKINVLDPNGTQVHTFELREPSNIPVVPATIFTTFPSLRTLTFPNASVKTISSETFVNATNLQYLDLAGNQLRTIQARTFAPASKLYSISLNWNQIDNIENNALDGLEELRKFSAIGNRLRVLQRNALIGAKQLFSLRLDSNELETIEDGALDLPELRELILSHNWLTSLNDQWLAQATNAYLIDLSYNRLTHIGNAFTNARNVSILMLDNNPFENLHLNEFVGLSKLDGLSLNDTGLILHPDDLNDWPHGNATKSPLARLNLAYNNLTTGDVMKHLSAFSELNVVILNNNELTHLHEANKIKQHFPQLNIIGLVSNPICDWLLDSLEVLQRDEIVIHYSCSTIF